MTTDLSSLIERIEALTAIERVIFDALGPVEDCGCRSFNHLASETSLPRDAVQVGCRSLRRQGLAECYRGLWTDDGEPYGSDYGLSRDVASALKARNPSHEG